MKKKPYKVMVVEDQSLSREFFSLMIEKSPDYELLYSVSSASVAKMYCDRYDMDLVLMDVVMDDGSNGLDEAERIKKSHPGIKIIIITSMPESAFLERAKEIGVDGFWYKDGLSSQDNILKVMDLAMEGKTVYPSEAPVTMLGNCKSTDLTEMEIKVLRELTKGISNAEIGKELYISAATVKTHVSNLLQKTGFTNRTELAIKARVSGLVVSQD